MISIRGLCIIRFVFLFPVLLCAANEPAKSFSGEVVAIEDGDTITVMNDDKFEKIRLYGVDAPEDGQAFSMEAKSFTSTLSLKKTVKIKPYYKDPKGRIVADVLLPDGKTLNHEIVQAGFAWWFQQYASDDKILPKLEEEARKARRGLWTDPNPIAPWLYKNSEEKNSYKN